MRSRRRADRSLAARWRSLGAWMLREPGGGRCRVAARPVTAACDSCDGLAVGLLVLPTELCMGEGATCEREMVGAWNSGSSGAEGRPGCAVYEAAGKAWVWGGGWPELPEACPWSASAAMEALESIVAAGSTELRLHQHSQRVTG